MNYKGYANFVTMCGKKFTNFIKKKKIRIWDFYLLLKAIEINK